jgi:lipoate-protein ligase A
MSHEAAYHDGYMRALTDLDRLFEKMSVPSEEAIEKLRATIRKRIEKARCLSHSSLAAGASGSRGY